mgnify:CR=1 FL=1
MTEINYVYKLTNTTITLVLMLYISIRWEVFIIICVRMRILMPHMLQVHGIVLVEDNLLVTVYCDKSVPHVMQFLPEIELC